MATDSDLKLDAEEFRARRDEIVSKLGRLVARPLDEQVCDQIHQVLALANTPELRAAIRPRPRPTAGAGSAVLLGAGPIP